jgi:hypothetical protein
MHAGGVFGRMLDGDLLVTSGPAAEVMRVSLRPLSLASAIRWCAHRRELMATAVPAGGKQPEIRANDRGELRLFRCDPREGT